MDNFDMSMEVSETWLKQLVEMSGVLYTKREKMDTKTFVGSRKS